MAEFFMTRAGAGVMNGSKWADAWPFIDSTDLKDKLEAVTAGDAFFYGTPQSVMQEVPIDIMMILNAQTGTVENPIKFYGAIVSASTVIEESSKLGLLTPLFYSDGIFPPLTSRNNGDIFLRIEKNNYLVSGLQIAHAESFITIRVNPVSGLLVENIQGGNIRGVIANGAGDSDGSDLAFNNMVFYAGGYFATVVKGSNISFTDCHWDSDGFQSGAGIYGIKAGTSAGTSALSGLFVDRCSFKGGYDLDGTPGYVQGDGIIMEKDVADVVASNTSCDAFGDGGFDFKSQIVLITNCRATTCKYGFKLWGIDNIVGRHLYGGACTRAAIQIPGFATIYDSKFVISDLGDNVINLPPNAVWGGIGGAHFERCVFETRGRPDRLINFGTGGEVITFVECWVDDVFYDYVRMIGVSGNSPIIP